MYIENSKTIVIKIGSSNLVDGKGKLKEKWLKSFVQDIKKYKKKRKKLCNRFFRGYCVRSKLFKN